MKITHYVIIAILVVGLLYVYHNIVANPGSAKGFLGGLGINR